MAGDDKHEERETHQNNNNNNNNNNNLSNMIGMSRKEKRKALKKMKRKQIRREIAVKEREKEEAKLNDPEEQMRLLRLEQEENERMERDRIAFEERERQFLQELEQRIKRQQEEEELQRKFIEESTSNSVDNEKGNELSEGDDWEYVEEGPAEIVWKGNEIIVKKKKVKVPKKGSDLHNEKQENERPISNPLAPQSEAFQDHKNAQEVLESVAQQVPNFGTEQDKAHCPFHLKTGVCRFGARCSRVHFYPDKSCTLLMKNMYIGPGLAWEQDEGLEYTDEDVEQFFEDFYEDVHTEFLKYGEIVNFKVCKNGSSHLRGNVYVHYKLLESAVLAYQSINGRYFAGKQISCEFVNLMRWKVAICGEYMKSRLKTCSRGSACNFIHCFRNPGGDYEWADWDRPAPRYWLKKMAALFGHTPDRLGDEVSPSYRSRRSRSRGSDSRNHSDEDDDWRRDRYCRRRGDNREGTRYLDEEMHQEKISPRTHHYIKHRRSDADVMSDGGGDDRRLSAHTKGSPRKRGRELELTSQGSENRKREAYTDRKRCSEKRESDSYPESKIRSSSKKGVAEFIHNHHEGNDKHNNFDLSKSPYTDRHRDERHRHKDRHSMRKKHKGDDSKVDLQGDKVNRDEDRCHRHSMNGLGQMKNEAELSDNASGGDNLGRDERRVQKKKRSSRSKNESHFADAGSTRERLDREERHRGHGMRSSRHHTEEPKLSISDSTHRYPVDRNVPEKKDKEDSHCGIDSRPRNLPSELNENHCEHDKVNDRHCASSCRDTISYSFEFQEEKISRYNDGDKYHDHCHKDHQSERDHKGHDVERPSPININNQETIASKKVETDDSHTDFQDVYEQSEDELEQAYRLAALKKLEEMRKHSYVQPTQNKEEIQEIELHSHGNKYGGEASFKVAEATKGTEKLSSSSKLEIRVAATKRRRI